MATVEGENRTFDRTWRYALLILGAVIFIFPLLFMVMSSLKPDPQLLADTSSLRAFLPVGDISLANYFAAFQRAPVATFIFNSVLVTGLTVVLSLFVCSLAAFAFVFLKWTGRDVVLAVIIATLIVPFETIAIPMLIVVNNLPWIGPRGLERRLAQQLPGADRAVHRRRPDDLSLRAVLQGSAARADRGLPRRGRDLVPDLLARGRCRSPARWSRRPRS